MSKNSAPNSDRDLSGVEPLRRIAKELVETRVAKGYTHRSLAVQAIISPRTIRRIEHCVRLPDVDTLKTLAMVLGVVDTHWLKDRETALRIINAEGGINSYPLLNDSRSLNEELNQNGRTIE